ncbi:hypothetical protein [Rhodobacteraceae phage LS06-2018-MD06]|jgi:hypothetical protein|nr:hypothetical protein [Rhodobacteraceae phage LS06-2018-MD06]
MPDGDILKMRMSGPYRGTVFVSEWVGQSGTDKLRELKHIIKGNNSIVWRAAYYLGYYTRHWIGEWLLVEKDKMYIGETVIFEADTKKKKKLIMDIYKHAAHQVKARKYKKLLEDLDKVK